MVIISYMWIWQDMSCLPNIPYGSPTISALLSSISIRTLCQARRDFFQGQTDMGHINLEPFRGFRSEILDACRISVTFISAPKR
jgi:hypothetical protein